MVKIQEKEGAVEPLIVSISSELFAGSLHGRQVAVGVSRGDSQPVARKSLFPFALSNTFLDSSMIISGVPCQGSTQKDQIHLRFGNGKKREHDD